MRISDWSSDVCSSDLRGLGILAIDAAIFLVDPARAVIDGREKHQRGFAATLLEPERRLDLLEVGRAHFEVPKLVGSTRPQTNRCLGGGYAGRLQPLCTEPPVVARPLTPAGGSLPHAP